jgi:hypothetical protein
MSNEERQQMLHELESWHAELEKKKNVPKQDSRKMPTQKADLPPRFASVQREHE